MRKTYELVSARFRATAIGAVRSAPDGYRVIIEEPQRSLPQNDAFWSTMDELSRTIPFAGKLRTKEEWRTLCISGWMQERGHAVETVQGLEGEPVALGLSSRRLRMAEMSEVLEYARAMLARAEGERAA